MGSPAIKLPSRGDLPKFLAGRVPEDSAVVPNPSRRSFAGSAATLGIGGLAGLVDLSRACADDGKPLAVTMNAAIAPLVRLIETTPRERAVATMVEQLRKGATVNQFVAAMFLASARINVSPHHVFMIHAAHRMSATIDAEHRLLPLFWALDTMLYRRKDGDRYPAPDLGRPRSPEQAGRELHAAMDAFDSKRAEAALVALSRGTNPQAALAQLQRYAARDDSFIGHRAIALTNCWRVLETIGWEHAEPVFQFVVRQLNAGERRHARHDFCQERARRVGELPKGWADAAKDHAVTLELFATLRAGDAGAAGAAAWDLLRAGKAKAGSVWDAVYLLGAEFMLRIHNSDDIGTTPVHTNTSANALRHAFDQCGDPGVKLYTLLGAVAWAAGYYGEQVQGKWFRELKLLALEPAEVDASAPAAVAAVFAAARNRKHDPTQKEILVGREGTRQEMDHVARLAFGYATKHADHRPFLQAARLLTAVKATQDAHDVKFPAAMFEHYGLIDPRWRPHLLAASTHYLHGTRMPDNTAVRQAKDALASPRRT